MICIILLPTSNNPIMIQSTINHRILFLFIFFGLFDNNSCNMDLDDELEMLQRELMAVQEEKTNPLSERTVAEIMVKLYHSGFSFIPTTDGNEYITPDKLDE
jgi:hypothetical protein